MNTRSCAPVLRLSLAVVATLLLCLVVFGFTASAADPSAWKVAWPKTDFSQHNVSLDEIRSGGPGKDGIPSIDKPRFVSVAEIAEKKEQADSEPVIGLEINGDRRAYPLRILIWHEIVNDIVGGVPVAVTYCPLCNSSIVFDRRVAGRVLEFGTTGNLRNSDLVMYDRETESWWQQFLGEGIVGTMSGVRLTALPARVESFALFRKRAPDGKVLVPTGDVNRAYGMNPYRRYDTSASPFLYDGDMPEGIAPLAYVLAVGDRAWSLDLIRKKKKIEAGDLVITWTAGQNSALDRAKIAEGRDIGNVIVQRRSANGKLVDVVHDLTFAFVFHAFRKGGTIHK